MYKKYADFALLFSAVIWGFGYVATALALEGGITPTQTMAIRFTIAFLLLVIVFYKDVKTVDFTAIKYGSFVGIFMFLGFYVQTEAMLYTTASKNAFLTATFVVMAPFLSWLVFKKAPDKFSFIGAFVCLCGVYLLSVKSGESLTDLNLGDILTLFCAFFYTCQLIATKIVLEKITPMQITIVQTGLTAIISIALMLFHQEEISFTSGGLWANLYLAVFSTFMAFILQNNAQKYLAPTKSAIILSTEGVFGTIFSAIVLKELITNRMLLGCAVIFVAIVMVETKFSFIFKKKVVTDSGE